MNVMLLNHHEAFLCPPLPPLPPCRLWKNCLPGNQLLLPKKGTTALDCQSIACPWLQWLVWGWAKTQWKTMKLLLKVLKETHPEAESRSMRYWPAAAALPPWRKKGQHSGDPVSQWGDPMKWEESPGYRYIWNLFTSSFFNTRVNTFLLCLCQLLPLSKKRVLTDVLWNLGPIISSLSDYFM